MKHDENINVRFGNIIRKMRQVRNMTQDELADTNHMTRCHISDIERGVISPTLNTIEQLAKCFNIEPCKLFQMLEDEPEIL